MRWVSRLFQRVMTANRKAHCVAVTRYEGEDVLICNQVAPTRLRFPHGLEVPVCQAHFSIFEAGLDVDVAVS